MRIFKGFDTVNSLKNTIVTIGTYDGVHIGHRAVLNKMQLLGKENTLTDVVLTFSPHPRLVVSKDTHKVKLIDTEEEKYAKLDLLGVSNLVIIPFDTSFAQLSYADFVKKYLVHKLNMKTLVFGKDHRFGHQRQGNMASLQELSNQYGFTIEYVDTFVDGVTEVSSTKIRIALENGHIETANRLLGNPFSLTAKVVHGKKNGHKIGFPTANLCLNNIHKMLPKCGVYAVQVIYKNKFYKGMLNMGFNPTIDDSHTIHSEVHIFDFDYTIYDSLLTVRFISRIRDERKFDSLYELKIQLEKDKDISLKKLEIFY